MKRLLLILLAGTTLLLGACSTDENDEINNIDDYLRCTICNKILTTNYYVCPKCKSNICPSCIKFRTGWHKQKECTKCGNRWQ